MTTDFNLIKLWHNIKTKVLKDRKIKKIHSNYNINSNIEQLSDNETDKTYNEILNKKKFIKNNRNKNLIKKDNYNIKMYNKRDKSLDIVRNNNDNYEIVMPYQRYKNNFVLDKKKILELKFVLDKKKLLELDNELKITNNNLNII